MKVYFSHGKESGPHGRKIKRLAGIAQQMGLAVERIDYTDSQDPEFRVERLLSRLHDESDDIVLVGSSMGGYVSLVASTSVNTRGLFLMAPALYMPAYRQQEYPSLSPLIEIVHGWSDTVIPPQHSVRYAQAANCTLHLISGDHPLNTSIEAVCRLFRQFLMQLVDE